MKYYRENSSKFEEVCGLIIEIHYWLFVR